MTSPSRALRARTLRAVVAQRATALQPAGFRRWQFTALQHQRRPLDAALSRFGAQAGITMAGSSTLTAGKNTRGLQGDFSTEAGLAQLLLGSGADL